MNRTILIADAGSTGTQWCAVSSDGTRRYFSGGPVNPAVFSPEAIGETLRAALSDVDTSECGCVAFYGAGCRPGKLSEIVAEQLRQLLPEGCEIAVNSDMLGAARAACGNSAGIACILGTGSNSCLYDGSAIIDAVPSLGYILGDEGSGAYLGRKLINAIYKRQLSKEICHSFEDFTGLNIDGIIERVYRQPQPNTFLASCAPFLAQNIDDDSIRAIVEEAFTDFIEQNIVRYENSHHYPLNFVGSIACYFNTTLQAVAEKSGYKTGRCIKSPLEGLIEYHTND